MDGSEMVDLLREAMLTASLAAAPVLIVGLLVGLLLGILQAATGVQEQTVGQLPRLAAMACVLALTLPWMLETFVELFQTTALWP